MADITNLFKATVKTVKSRNKAQGIQNDGDRNSILSAHRQKSEFSVKAKDVVINITKLRDFLLEHRKDYINASNHLNEINGMTDADRDQIDLDAQAIMKTCSDTIKSFRGDVMQTKMVNELREHREAVFDMIQSYLKAVCKIYSEQRAIRVKRVVDRKRISRLEPERHHKLSKVVRNDTASEKDSINSQLKSSLNPAGSNTTLDKPEEKTEDKASRVHHKPAFTPSFDDEDDDDDMSPEEMQMLEEENKHLFEEMNSMVDEVRNIEGKVVEISRLQEIFADKVLEQERDIDRIAETVVGTTENIKEGNEEIREAMKNNAGFRVWILFFLVVCSFSLLFLDWYNA